MINWFLENHVAIGLWILVMAVLVMIFWPDRLFVSKADLEHKQYHEGYQWALSMLSHPEDMADVLSYNYAAGSGLFGQRTPYDEGVLDALADFPDGLPLPNVSATRVVRPIPHPARRNFNHMLCNHTLVDGFGQMYDAFVCIHCGYSKYPEAAPITVRSAKLRGCWIDTAHPEYERYFTLAKEAQTARREHEEHPDL